MPYPGEFANKASHVDIVKNPDVARFLAGCSYLRTPSPDESRQIAARFIVPPPTDGAQLPEQVIAVDGSFHESSIDDALPSTKLGYVKVSSVLIDMAQYRSLRVGPYVDPFRVAALEQQNRPLTFTLPSANITTGGHTSVRDSFRAALDEQLLGEPTRFDTADHTTSLRTTLFHLAALRPDAMGTGDPSRLIIHRCPTCAEGPVEVEDVPGVQLCPHCGAEVFPTDCLRIWEEVTDFQSNAEAISRAMTLIEHLLPFHYVRYLAEHSLVALGATAFFVDGPLAVFGNGAWLHASILRFMEAVNERLARAERPRLLLIGLQKSGQLVDHATLIARHVPAGRLYAVEDEYRYRYVTPDRDPAQRGFGDQTYYGQDFIYRTDSGRTFAFALPYPFADKEGRTRFHREKAQAGRYVELARALALIRHFESDLYANAVVPIALAHRYTAISLSPGGRVLDLLTRKSLRTT